MSNAKENRAKYLEPPTFDQIDAFRKLLNVRVATFERFFGISKGSLRKIKKGERKLATDKWHIVYEKIIPAYGSGFLNEKMDTGKNMAKKQAATKKKKISTAIMDKLSSMQ